MSAKKPLIFVAPLNESLQKLKEVIEEVAEDEKIEIFEVDDASEVAQLIPTVGQSLSIFGNPKKCAMVLQPNRKVIQKLNSKVILLTKKSMPRKTLDKFSKIGLTECIVEPVAPKTLLYKVRLLLRSIVVADDTEDEEVETSFGASDSDSVDKDEKQRLEKGIMADDEDVLDYNMKSKKDKGLDLSADEDEEEKKKSYAEEAIQKEWKGKVNENNLSFEEEEEKKKKDIEESENYIDSYLRGKKSKTTDELFDDDVSTQKKSQYEEEDDLGIHKLNKEMTLNLEADEDEDEDDHDHDDLYGNDDKYYKGKVSSVDMELDADNDDDAPTSYEEEEEELSKKKRENSLDMSFDEDDTQSTEDDSYEEGEDIYERERDFALDLEADEDDDQRNSEAHELDEEGKRSRTEEEMALDLDPEERKRRKAEQELSLEDDRERPEFEKQDEEDKGSHMRGKVAKVVELIDEEDIDARNRHDLMADEELEKDYEEDEKSLDIDADEDDLNKETKLDLEDGHSKSNEETEDSLDLDADEDGEGARDKLDLELMGDEGNHSEDEEHLEDYDDEVDGPAASLNLSLEDGEAAQKEKTEEDDSDYARRKAGLDLDLEDDFSQKRHSAHTEHIETNLDSRKGIKHQEQDWDILGQKDKDESFDEEKKKKSDIQISFKEAVDLGEQTIDYRKLQSEFDAITINRVGGKRRRTGPKYYSEDMTDEEYLKSVYGEDYEDALDDIAQGLKNRKDQATKKEVFHPRPQGIDQAIKVMNLYHNKSLNKLDIFAFMATSLLEDYGGHSFFFTMDHEKNEFSNTYSLLSKEEGVDEEVLERWPELKEEMYDQWLEMNLPKWSDEKMITEDNVFFYPIYEGANKLGFVIVMFNRLIEKDQAKSIEIILETARGIVLDEFHKAGKEEKYDVDLRNKEDGQTEEKGFFKSLFGKFGKKAS